MLFGLLGALSGHPLPEVDTDAYVKLTVSAPFNSEFEFAGGSVSAPGGVTASSVSGWPGGGFYFLTPSLSGTDAWHHEHGYVGSTRSAQSYMYSKDNGYRGHFQVSVSELDINYSVK